MHQYLLVLGPLLATTVCAQNSGQAALPPCILNNCEDAATAATGCTNASDVYCHCTHQQPIFAVILPCVQTYCTNPAGSLGTYNSLFGGACSQYNISVPAPGINAALPSNRTAPGSGGYPNGTAPAQTITTTVLSTGGSGAGSAHGTGRSATGSSTRTRTRSSTTQTATAGGAGTATITTFFPSPTVEGGAAPGKGWQSGADWFFNILLIWSLALVGIMI